MYNLLLFVHLIVKYIYCQNIIFNAYLFTNYYLIYYKRLHRY